MTTRQVMERAIETYGYGNQLVKAIEEMAELEKELCKVCLIDVTEITERHLDNIAQEIADTEIMLEQLKIIFDNQERVEEWKKLKLLRLEYRLKQKGAQA